MKTINFYFPLRADIISRDDDGFDYDNPYEVYGGTLSEYKKAIVPYKTAAFVPEDRCQSVRFKCFSPYMSACRKTPLMSGVKLTQLIEKQNKASE